MPAGREADAISRRCGGTDGGCWWSRARAGSPRCGPRDSPTRSITEPGKPTSGASHSTSRPSSARCTSLARAPIGSWPPTSLGGGAASLKLSISWLDRLTPIAPVLIPVQDGCDPEHVADIVGDRVGVFIGGDPRSNWKELTAPAWGELGRARSCHVHMGRVNTTRRILLALGAGVHSFDGTSATRYSVNLPKLDGARRQGAFGW